MNSYLRRTIHLFLLLFIAFLSQAQVTDTYTSATTWTVPAGITSITIKVYGGAGGTGGQDCGAGCSNAAAGNAGYVLALYNVTPGDVIGIYPGGKGANGANSVSGSGGGSGGADTYASLNFNGGNGGNAGSSGSSGGGGGGGAASVVAINSTIKIVAGGAGRCSCCRWRKCWKRRFPGQQLGEWSKFDYNERKHYLDQRRTN